MCDQLHSHRGVQYQLFLFVSQFASKFLRSRGVIVSVSSNSTGGLLSCVWFEYTSEELPLITMAHILGVDGKEMRVANLTPDGYRCMLLGSPRHFWVISLFDPASRSINLCNSSSTPNGFENQNDWSFFHDCSWLVRIHRLFLVLTHHNGRPIRDLDTAGMFPGGLPLIFDDRCRLEMPLHFPPGSVPESPRELTDDVLFGESRRTCMERFPQLIQFGDPFLMEVSTHRGFREIDDLHRVTLSLIFLTLLMWLSRRWLQMVHRILRTLRTRAERWLWQHRVGDSFQKESIIHRRSRDSDR